MKITYLLVAIIVLLSAALVYVMQDTGCKTPGDSWNAPIYLFLYPERCVNCVSDCTDCEKYTDTAVRSVANDLGIKINTYISDAVREPNLFVAANNVSGLGVANSRYNVLSTICEVAKNEKACNLKNNEINKMKDCLSVYNISHSTIIYYFMDNCDHCKAMSRLIEQKKSENVSILEIKSGEMTGEFKCIRDFINERYAPQVFCPKNAASKVGRLSSTELSMFINKCQRLD